MESVEKKGEGDEQSVDLLSTLPGHCRRKQLCQYGGFWFTDFWLLGMLAAQRRFVARPDDIFVASCPKSGTTWLKALVFSVVHRSRYRPSDPNHPLRGANPHDCVPFLEEVFTADQAPSLDALPSPRICSAHTPYSALPETVRDSGCRVVYVARDPKDVFVSHFHFYFLGASGMSVASPVAVDEAFELFCSGVYSFGPLWEHALEYWHESLRRPSKVLFLRYEEMKGDTLGILRKLAGFLGYPFSAAEEREGVVEAISELCSFRTLSGLDVNKEGELETFKSVPFKRNSFFRRGEVGDWRNHLNSEMAQRLDMITEEKLRGTGLKLY